MPSKPNYNHQRAERNRAKQAKKEEKLMQKKDQSAQRRATKTGGPANADDPAKDDGA